jgi:hypothetical protein
MIRLTFEFPTPSHAETFAEELLDGTTTRHHRVVEAEVLDAEDCRQLARRHGGREGTLNRTLRATSDGMKGKRR